MHVALSAIRSLQDSGVKGQAAITECTNANNTNYKSFREVAYGECFLLNLRSQNTNDYLYYAEKANHKTPKQLVLGCEITKIQS
ncbi:hypothetical protein [Arsenophonus sp. PmNCSU2021_1]|uniref:hypothetical protein n=1 Tax=Arsenophonus sp. PmNCSU2021_1 TaxID=3118989 RepID=UPI002FEF460A